MGGPKERLWIRVCLGKETVVMTAFNYRAVEDVEGGEQRRGAMAFAVMRHLAGTARLHWQFGCKWASA